MPLVGIDELLLDGAAFAWVRLGIDVGFKVLVGIVVLLQLGENRIQGLEGALEQDLEFLQAGRIVTLVVGVDLSHETPGGSLDVTDNPGIRRCTLHAGEGCKSI